MNDEFGTKEKEKKAAHGQASFSNWFFAALKDENKV